MSGKDIKKITPVKDFNIVEMYIQQRDSKGNPIGDKLYLIKPKDGRISKKLQPVQLPTILSLEIMESMIEPSIKGSFVFVDRERIVENLKLSPLDLVYMKLKEELDGESIIKEFMVSITTVSQISEDANAAKLGPVNQPRNVEIHFAANEHYLLNFSYFDFMENDFIGPISGKNGIIQYLSEKVFKKGGTPFSTATKAINADYTSNYVWVKKNYNFYPWGKPTYPPLLSSFIQMLIENAVDKNNPNAANFFFWQDMDGWNFKSVESIIENQKDYETYHHTAFQSDARGIVSMDLRIDGDPETDFMEALRLGAFGSNYLFVEPKYQQDPYARFLDTSGSHEIRKIEYVYTKDYENWSSIEELPMLSDKEYVPAWSNNRIYDQHYGYFEPNFFNRKKTVDWEYYGYTYSNRQENTLWQTVFDITDMDGETLRKIQKEIKEPLAKKRLEYAKKMNLKEKWKVYRCSICCAGIEDTQSGLTCTYDINRNLSKYEIVAAGSFTDILNYDSRTITGPCSNPFARSGITLSYNLNESPYDLSLGEFFNLEQQPSNFIKYRFDLEIKRHEKMLEILDSNISIRQARVQKYTNEFNVYKEKWLDKLAECQATNCEAEGCLCDTEKYDALEKRINQIKQAHLGFIQHENKIKEKLQSSIDRLNSLKSEFIATYSKYWSRDAFFFSKDIDYSFLKSGNNLFNVKSIKRIPIKGSKYEPFETRKAFKGYTFPDGSTSIYDYGIEHPDGPTFNPYFERGYAVNIDKADFTNTFQITNSDFAYTDYHFKEEPKGPVWYRNWNIKYKYKEPKASCLLLQTDTNPGECCPETNYGCICGCNGPTTVICSEPDCTDIEGFDGVTGACTESKNNEFVFGCTSSLGDCITQEPGDPCPRISNGIIEECCDGRWTPSACDQLEQDGISNDCLQSLGCSGGQEPEPCAEPECSCIPDIETFYRDVGVDSIGIPCTNIYYRASCVDWPRYDPQTGCLLYNCPSVGSQEFLYATNIFACNGGSPEFDQSAEQQAFDWIANNCPCHGGSSIPPPDGGVASGTPQIQPLVAGTPAPVFGICNTDQEQQYNEVQLRMNFEVFSSSPNDSVLNSNTSVIAFAEIKLKSACPDGNSDCIQIISAEPISEIKLYHPWAADELESGFDYQDYKKSASLFVDDLNDKKPPHLKLQELESYVRIEFNQPIGLETLKEFPDGFVNTPGTEYFLPYIVLLTAGPFGAEAAKANVSVIGQDPYGFDIAVKKTKNKDDFSKMNLVDQLNPLFWNPFSTTNSWLKTTQNNLFYKPNSQVEGIFAPSGIMDIFSSAGIERSMPAKSWWDMWCSLPPVAMALYYNRHDVSSSGRGIGFFKTNAMFGEPKTMDVQGGWPIFVQSDTEMMTTGVVPFDASLVPVEGNAIETVTIGNYTSSISPLPKSDVLNDDPSNYVYKYSRYPSLIESAVGINYPVSVYPVGTKIWNENFEKEMIWRYDVSKKTQYGIVQLSSDSMPSIMNMLNGLGGNAQEYQRYYDWVNHKMVDWFQNTIFDNNFSAQFVVMSRNNGCEGYPCMNPGGFPGTDGCPPSDPLCNCPCQDIRPDKITKVKDRITGKTMAPPPGDFGLEPSVIELRKLKDETNECKLIKQVLGEEWLGCVWDDPDSPYNCNCPCIGKKFYDYMKYNQLQSTFWSTPLKTPLYRRAQMTLLMANKLRIEVPGDFKIKPGMIIKIDSGSELIDYKKKRYEGKWLVLEADHFMKTSAHMMVLTLVRDSNPKLVEQEAQDD